MNSGYTYRDTIRPVDNGRTVIEFYTLRYSNLSEQEWRERISKHQIVHNGKVAAATNPVSTGDQLEYHRPPWTEPEVPTEIEVLYSDKDLVVFNKPTGLPVLPGGGYLENTMLNLVRNVHGEALSPIHRLGRGTTGAILFTREPRASVKLSEAMRNGNISKTYLALVDGLVAEDRFQVDVPIGPIPHPLLGNVHAASDTGKPSLSIVQVLDRRTEDKTSLLRVDIPTGRPHQIRIHMAYAGYPLHGDPLYRAGGGFILPDNPDDTAVPGDCGYFLHSWKLVFIHPATDSPLEIMAPAPDILSPPNTSY